MESFEERKEIILRRLIKLRDATDRSIKEIDLCDTDFDMKELLKKYRTIITDLRTECE